MTLRFYRPTLTPFQMMNALLGIPLPILGDVCIAVAVIYYFVWPKPGANAPARPLWMQFILRWFHSAVWVAFGLVCFAAPAGNAAIASALAFLALALYVIFMVTLVIDRRKGRRSGKP